MKTTITVLDFMNYLTAHSASWLPISGLVIKVLKAKANPDTILEVPKDEEDKKIYDKVLAWVRKQKR